MAHCPESGARRGRAVEWRIYSGVVRTQISKRDIRVAAGTRQFKIRYSYESREGHIRREFVCIVFYSCQFGFCLAERFFPRKSMNHYT